MITTVTSNSGLSSALSSAHAGDTILLAAGSYSKISLSNVSFAGQVTITSADPAHMALVQGISVSNSSGLTFADLSVSVAPNTTGVAALNSSNVVFDALKVQGPGSAIGGLGFMVANSTNVTVSNSDISGLWGGINHQDDTGLTISGNKLHDLQEDAIRGGGSSNVVVANNFVTDIHPLAGDHPDAIQFWGTAAHPTVHDISITGNVYVRGAGEAAQGIFVADGAYQNVTVTNNAMVGALYNGIVVSGATNAVIQGNLVEGYTDQGSWIGVATSNNVQVSGNQATGLLQLSPNTNYAATNNTSIHPGAVGDTTVLHNWEQVHVTPPAPIVPPPPVLVVPVPPVVTPLPPTTTPQTPDVVSPVSPPVGQPEFTTIVVEGPYGPISITVPSSLSSGAPTKVSGGSVGGLMGTAGSDLIDGHGGADTMSGTGGNDTYVVNDAHDMVVEARNGGADTVLSSVSSYTLTNQVENLRLVGTTTQTGVGNGLDNVLTDNGVSSKLSGGLGNDTLVTTGGSDTLTGGTGHDVFQFQALPKGVDSITDFTRGDDRLDLHPLLGAYHGTNPVADGWVKFQVDGGGTTVLVDVDGPSGHGGFVAIAKLAGVTSALTAGTDWVF